MSRHKNVARILTFCLGGFWLLDGILQLQPAMFTNVFVSTVLAPNLQNQPTIIASIVAFGIRVFTINIFWFNLASALIQLLIAALLLFPVRVDARRFGLWLSAAWALIVWIFGEGFGGLATGSATFYTGAPGSALLYLILALFLLYSQKELSRESLLEKLPVVAGAFFLLGAALNFAPMFWQAGIAYNLLAIAVLTCLGALLLFLPNRPVAWIAIIFLLAVWWIGQSFGGLLTFPGGTATDPNSAPIFILFLLPIFFLPDTMRIPGRSRS